MTIRRVVIVEQLEGENWSREPNWEKDLRDQIDEALPGMAAIFLPPGVTLDFLSFDDNGCSGGCGGCGCEVDDGDDDRVEVSSPK